ncbi:putative pre-mRNA-splicing factor ATP-dependent RNA helicase mog-1 [Frankliniella fusca]|uniref:Pre-mRNA-splicing factor ATP-dependent RNA helicase mog-1 n=1 Tax=Frankliniella fusca TaxID=407009 RepID=A0AAE1HY04_9NEOP|nr:putative pre-mRNA-splicing factor ATP-dependent RNA helicase mog-1 [Frankliniella fusca]
MSDKKNSYDTPTARSDKKRRVTVAGSKVLRSDKRRSDNRCRLILLCSHSYPNISDT